MGLLNERRFLLLLGGVVLVALGLAFLVGGEASSRPKSPPPAPPAPRPTRLAPLAPTPTPTPRPPSAPGPARFRLEVEERGPLSYSVLLAVRVRAPLLARLTNLGAAPAEGVVVMARGWVGSRPVDLNGAPVLRVPVGDLAPGETAEVPVDLEVRMGLADLGPARSEGLRFQVEVLWNGGRQVLPDLVCTLQGCGPPAP